MRNLVTLQTVSAIKPIKDADAIELAIVKGWQCVVKKGEFKSGDPCVYFEVDSYLPIDDGRYEFLIKNSRRNNEYMGEGLRIRTITLRGELSQGLCLPASLFPELQGKYAAAGADLTELLGVRKWEVPEQVNNAGIKIGEKPYALPTTDETRIQSMPEFLQHFTGKPYYISTKMDGTSCTVVVKDGKISVCGRNFEYKEDDESCAMWAWIHKHGIDAKLHELGENIALQSEFCGEGVQKNRMKLHSPEMFVFDVVKIGADCKLTKLGLEGIQSYCNKLGMKTVPIEEAGDSFQYTMDELLERAKGKYDSGLDKEGIVIRAKEYGRALTPDGILHKLSFKVLNNDFLKKEKD